MMARTEPTEMWEKKGMFEFYVKEMKLTEKGKSFKENIKMSILTEQISSYEIQRKCIIKV